MSDISTQLKTARILRGLSLRTVGRMVGISSSSLNRWEAGIGCPSDEMLEILSSVLRTQFRSLSPEKVKLSAMHRGALLRTIRHRVGCSQMQAAKLFGCSRSAISRWELGDRDQDSHVVQLYVEAFRPATMEIEALHTRETVNPILGKGDGQLSVLIDGLRTRRIAGHDEGLDLSYLAADAQLGPRDVVERMRLYDAYIEHLEWKYRHREAAHWGSMNLRLAKGTHNYDFVGRAVRATAHQLITEMGQPERGTQFLMDAVKLSQGFASEAMIARELADRLAQAGCLLEAVKNFKIAKNAFDAYEREGEQTGCRFVQASIAIAAGRFESALEVLESVQHSDPYMQNHLTQLKAESRHGLGEHAECERILEDGIRQLDRPGLTHFSNGLIDRLGVVRENHYSPDLWRWGRSGADKRHAGRITYRRTER